MSESARRDRPGTTLLRRQHELALRVASFVRDRGDRPARVAVALLLAASTASLVACSDGSADVADEIDAAVQPDVGPLAQEVRTGLPARPGRYPLAEGIGRDPQGVYHFSWRDSQSSGPSQLASASLVRLAAGERDELEVPEGDTPILHLRSETPIQLVDTSGVANEGQATPTPSMRSGGGGFFYPFGVWYPFFGTGYVRGPIYRDPPLVTTASGTPELRGARTSTTPAPPAERVTSPRGLKHAVSGMNRGTGAGTAATGKSGAGASPPRSGGFSTGTGGSTSAGG